MFIGSKEDLTTKRFLLDDVSFVNEIESGNLTIQTRYNSQDLPCELNQINESECEVMLNSPTLGVAPVRGNLPRHKGCRRWKNFIQNS